MHQPSDFGQSLFGTFRFGQLVPPGGLVLGPDLSGSIATSTLDLSGSTPSYQDVDISGSVATYIQA